MSDTVSLLIELACTLILAVGVGLAVGGLAGALIGVGCALVVLALVGFVLVIAAEMKGGS